MRVDKVVLRAALSTVAAIVVLFGFMIFTLCYVYPSTMMNITYDLGMENASITCAKRSYKRSGEVYYIAFATETAIIEENYEQIATCGKLFTDDEAFSPYCERRNAELGTSLNGSYEQYVYGQVCVAEYKLGDKEKAVDDAFAYLGNTFPNNNAVEAVLVTAIGEKDEVILNKIKGKMASLQNTLSETDRAHFEEVFVLLQKE